MTRKERRIAVLSALFFGGILAVIFLFPSENFRLGTEEQNALLDRGSYFLGDTTHYMNLYFKKEMDPISVKNIKNYKITHVKRDWKTRQWLPVDGKEKKAIEIGLPTWDRDKLSPQKMEMTLILPVKIKPEPVEFDAFLVEAKNLKAKNGQMMKGSDRIIVYVPKYFKFRKK